MRHTEFGITVTSKMRHAALLAGARKCGSVAAMARYLGLHVVELHRWVNLAAVPPFLRLPSPRTDKCAKARETTLSKLWPPDRIVALEKNLFDLTGQTLEQLFPRELCANKKFLDACKQIEQTKQISSHLLGSEGGSSLLLPPPDAEVEQADMDEFRKKRIAAVLKTLTYREQEIIKLRYGLFGGDTHTLEETAAIFKITRERIRQIEARAIRNISTFEQRMALEPCLDDFALNPKDDNPWLSRTPEDAIREPLTFVLEPCVGITSRKWKVLPVPKKGEL